LMNGILTWTHGLSGLSWLPATLQQMFGMLFAPIAWLVGISWQDATRVGDLMGTRLVINEFVAFSALGSMRSQLSLRSFTIATYALCGFANFTSIAIQIGAIGALAPSRRSDLARFGLRAVTAGTMANLMSAAIVSLFL
jgi:CNT family concentrative nucleoside transporter